MANSFSRIIKPSITMQPPTAREMRRNELVLALFVLVILVAGWFLRGVVRAEQKTAALGDGMPTIVYPADWAITTPAENILFFVRNPASPSTFNTQMHVEALPMLEGDALEALRLATSLRRNQELDYYREVRAEQVTIGDGAPAMLVTYAYIADPTRESGAAGLPVVVEAQDLLFRAGNQWLIVTTAADATRYEAESAPFAQLFDHLQVQFSQADDQLSSNQQFSSEGMEP